MSVARTITARKAGNKPPAAVVRALRKQHPTVKLWWATDVQRWALVQIVPGQRPWLIQVLRGPRGEYATPTMANTLHVLRRGHWSNLEGWAGKRALEQMDEQWENASGQVDRDQEGLRREMANEMFNAHRGRIVLAKP